MTITIPPWVIGLAGFVIYCLGLWLGHHWKLGSTRMAVVVALVVIGIHLFTAYLYWNGAKR